MLHLEMQYLSVIRNALPRDSILVTDNTQLGYWAEYFYPTYCPGGLICSKGSSTIGFAFAAAMGAKLAFPKNPAKPSGTSFQTPNLYNHQPLIKSAYPFLLAPIPSGLP